MEQFINLNRLFNELPIEYTYNSKDDNIELNEFSRFQKEGLLGWSELLQSYRIVILAEAGAGKTQEIWHATQHLQSEGKYAFFLRLEHIVDDLESAFEIGTFQEFQNWIDSNDEGWILLDSVDEARLKDPKDFKRALQKLAAQIAKAKSRAHLIITSRITAWRPKSDLKFCNSLFPDVLPILENGKSDIHEDTFSEQARSEAARSQSEQQKAGFKVYSLADLTREQIVTFVEAKGIKNSAGFLNDLERRDAWAFTTRPQDLDELVSFWNDKQRLGSRFELMEHSVKRRLSERDQDRAESRPFTVEKAQKGALLLASASVLMHKSVFQIPDGTNYGSGIDVNLILKDWDDIDIQTLLSRPLFDEAIYGTVRFHHRSVREYLAAVWIAEELKRAGSRQKIEHLFFRTQYEQEVIIPSMRPVLSWLVLLDTQLLLKVYNLEPELILEGGDPSRVPLEIRQKILASICQGLDSASFYRPFEERVAIQRFASIDLVNDIIHLLKEYRHNTTITTYLLNLVWQGQMKAALPVALSFASDPTIGIRTRITAVRVIKEVGEKKDLDSVWIHFLREESAYDRSLLAELVDDLEASQESIAWLLEALANTQDAKKYDYDSLGYSLLNFVNRADVESVSKLVEGIDLLLHRQPIVESSFYELSKQYGWLVNVSIKAIEKLIINRHPAALTSASLFVLTLIPVYYRFGDSPSWSPTHNFHNLIPEWPQLNQALFWKHIEEARKHQKEPLTDFWRFTGLDEYWKFTVNEFQQILSDVSLRPLLDDRLVALSLAFHLYIENERPLVWLNDLRQSVAHQPALTEKLDGLLNPPAPTKKWIQHIEKEAEWRRKQEEEEKQRQQEHADHVKWLNENVEKIRSNDLEQGANFNAQYDLYLRMKSINGSSKDEQIDENWRSLTKEYGLEIAIAFRDGLLGFWRTYTPTFQSEDNEDIYTFGIEFGLAGLELESSQLTHWSQDFSEEEVEIACRYAFRELNRFPSWFPRLYEQHPQKVSELVTQEIGWELEGLKENKHYVLSKVCWSGEWLWNSIAEAMLVLLDKEPIHISILKDLLKIVQGSSSISNHMLAQLAERKCNAPISITTIPYWYATWISVDPKQAIKPFSNWLAGINLHDQQKATQKAMIMIVALLGKRRSGSGFREAFKTTTHLMQLYQLMHQYIRVENDLHRANSGAYSPELRDDAQEARDDLLSMLQTIPGKETYLALKELARTHPVEDFRNRLKRHAKEREEIDSDSLPWNAEQFNEFAKTLECTLGNPRELFELAVQRLLDLKHSLEEGDYSTASTWAKEDQETGIRKAIADWCESRSLGKYSITQEEEMPDAKRPDLRFLNSYSNSPIPVELKLADNWSGSKLFERLENQLCGDYLRDIHSYRGIYVIVYRGKMQTWNLPNSNIKVTFAELVEALQAHWMQLSPSYPKIEQIAVIGIDLTKRTDRVKPAKKK
ncbi:NACHT domain-containing NTPase [Siphonobacter sp. BAB-5385]|uniref:NACHT domain-containing protein n=1 Tax=Siphonobacter sp. BAB-5385 TaxID=1864822 RepID=UPI00114089B2|nr:hypothetical protein [Siphonobacter sp. BAB-5385]